MHIFAVLLSVSINILADFVDKSVANRENNSNLPFWSNVIQFLLILPLIGLASPLRFPDLCICAAVGAVTAYGRIAWFQALATHGETLSRLTPFLRLSSVFVLLGAIVILREPFSPTRFAGGCMIITASILALLSSPLRNIRGFLANNRAPILVLVSAFTYAAIPILYKYLVSGGYDLFSIFFHLKLFQAFAIMMVAARSAISTFSNSSFATFKLTVIARVLQTFAALTYLFAIGRLDLSVAEPIAALGPFIVMSVEAIQGRWFGSPSEAAAKQSPTQWINRSLSIGLVSAGMFLMIAKFSS